MDNGLPSYLSGEQEGLQRNLPRKQFNIRADFEKKVLEGNFDFKKQTIFWDVDDVLLNTNETMVEYLNRCYLIPNGKAPKTKMDCKDWGYRSIWKDLSFNEMEDIFGRPDFWRNMTIKSGFIDVLNSGVLNHFNNILVSKGSEQNLSLKYNFLFNNIDKWFSGVLRNNFYMFYGFSLLNPKIFDCSGAIYVEDNFDNLAMNNAKLNILIKNGIETEYNNSYNPKPLDNLYIVENVEDIIEILQFSIDAHVIL